MRFTPSTITFALIAVVFMTGMTVTAAHAEEIDLILPPTLASADAPFYQQAQIKIGEDLIPVREGNLPKGTLAQYQPEKKAVIISNTASASEAEKGRALLDMMAALQASAIAPAAGQ